MDIRAAILAAADHIEAHPEAFHFIEPQIPKGTSCGSPGCALGWIGFFMGMDCEKKTFMDVPELLGLGKADFISCLLAGNQNERPDIKFYARLSELDYLWQGDAVHCARALRLYADKYHPAPAPVVQHDGIPQAVMDIFAVPTKQTQVRQ